MAPALCLILSCQDNKPRQYSFSCVFIIVCAHDGRCRNLERLTFFHRMGLCKLPLTLSNSKVSSCIFDESRLLMKPLIFLSPTSTGHLFLRWWDLWSLIPENASCILGALHPLDYSLCAVGAGFLLGPLAIHLQPISASHTCKCNIDLPWALITSPFNPQPPSLRERV